MEKIGLVLSGGGSKGAYEAGVYKALKKLKIKIDVVTGTSIGAVNGMFVVQKDLWNALRFWKSISFSKMYKESDFPPMEDSSLSKVYAQYVKTFVNEGGMDVSKMEKLFDKYYKPYKFFNSDIDYGLVTYNLSKKKPVFKTKKDLKKDEVKSYVIASASCYPAFKPYVIDNDLYIDGGYHDNIPINLAIKLGATKIIAVDLRAVGFKKKISDESVDVTYIAPRNKIESFLVFDKNKAREAIKFGYNDAMKTFGKLDGNKFTFKKNNLVSNYNKYNDLFENNLNGFFEGVKSPILKKVFESTLFKEILDKNVLYDNFNDIVEKSGEFFDFIEYNVYNVSSYNRKLIKSLNNTETINLEKIINKVKGKNFKNLFSSCQIVKYFYNAILDNDKSVIKYIPIFSDEFLSALYIYTIGL